MDLYSPITVVESKVSERTITDKAGRRKQVRHIGVSFINTDGRVCWTNFKTDGKGKGKGTWMTVRNQDVINVTVTPLPGPLPPAMSQPVDGGANTATSNETDEFERLD